MKLAPNVARRLLRRACNLHRRGDLFGALPIYERVLDSYPTHPEALHYAALLGRQLHKVAASKGVPAPLADDALLGLMEASVIAAPHNAAAIHNFAKFKHERGEWADARRLYENAVGLNPDQGESWIGLGNVYGELGNRMRMEACWIRARECPVSGSDARFNMAYLELLKGDYENGWRDFESRLDCPEFLQVYGRGDLSPVRWDGAPLDGTLLLHGEQGAGDAIMMARYIPLVVKRAGRVIVEVISGLVSLFAEWFPHLEMVAKGDAVPAHDAQCSLLSLPHRFATTLETIPEQPRFRVDSDAFGTLTREQGDRLADLAMRRVELLRSLAADLSTITKER